ncbi:MAG: hypothetical protein U9N36_01715 [Euryarchaeota archaeon]|nr:hypothetical protein [Euryarchaeota archaeon]
MSRGVNRNGDCGRFRTKLWGGWIAFFFDVIGELRRFGNYSGMLIGCPIAILYFLARKITAEGAEER